MKCDLRPNLDFEKKNRGFNALEINLDCQEESRFLNPAFSALFGIQVAVRFSLEWKLHQSVAWFSAKATDSSEVPIHFNTFENRFTSYLCPKSNVIVEFPVATRATAKFSQLRSSNIFDIFHKLNDYFKSHSFATFGVFNDYFSKHAVRNQKAYIVETWLHAHYSTPCFFLLSPAFDL